MQRKATAPGLRAAAPRSRSSSAPAMDTWMDAANRGVTAMPEQGQDPVLDRNGVITDHEYALNGVNRSAGTVTLYNPWGRRHLENVDMAFVRANFQSVRFLNLPSSR